MRAALTATAAAISLLATISVGQASGFGHNGGPPGGGHHYKGPPFGGFGGKGGGFGHNHHPGPHLPGKPGNPWHHGPFCKKIVVKVPAWTLASWGRSAHRHPHGGHFGGFVIKKIVILCHRPPVSP